MNPTKKGDKFTAHSTGNEVFTVKYFFGESGAPFDTAQECIKNNSNQKPICVANVEYDGAHNIKHCKLV